MATDTTDEKRRTSRRTMPWKNQNLSVARIAAGWFCVKFVAGLLEYESAARFTPTKSPPHAPINRCSISCSDERLVMRGLLLG